MPFDAASARRDYENAQQRKRCVAQKAVAKEAERKRCVIEFLPPGGREALPLADAPR